MIKGLSKALICVFLCFGLLCGCGKGKITPIFADFSCKGEAELDSFTIQFEMTRLSGQLFEITVTAPENLSGLCYTKNGDQTLLSYKGIELGEDSDGVAEGMFASFICDAFSTAEREEVVATTANPTHKSRIKETDFEMTFRPDGFVTELKFNQKNTTVTLTDFEYK